MNTAILKIQGDNYELHIASYPELRITSFTKLEELMKYFDFKTIYFDRLKITHEGGEIYKVQKNSEKPIFIKSLKCTLLFTIVNYHLSKK